MSNVELELHTRIARLERNNRRLVGGALALVAAVGGLGLMSMRSAVCDSVSAERFVLVDPNGRQRAVLTAYETNGQPRFTLLDAKGKALATLAAEKDGAFLALTDASGERTVRYAPSAASAPEGCESKKECEKKSGDATVADFTGAR